MNSSGKFSYVIRKYPSLRVLISIVVLAIIFFSILIFNHKTRLRPVIDSVVPPVGLPGDVVLINGQNFGKVRDMSYVSFAGNKLTASSYISWTDDCIKVVLPANVQDGLVVVGVDGEVSNPALFANEVDIPVPVQTSVQSSRPVVTNLSVSKGKVGDLLVLQGNNFGDTRNRSSVYFTVDYNNKIEESDFKGLNLLMENLIPVTEEESGYEFWSNTEVRVRIPDGAYTGVVVIDNGKESSEPVNFSIDYQVGRKRFVNKKIYLVQYSADVADVVTNDVSTITLRCPLPVSCVSQTDVKSTDIVPEPILYNYQNNLIHQITKTRNNLPKSVFRQTFVITVYETKSTVVEDKVASLKKAESERFAKYLKSDDLVPSDDEQVKKLASEIVKKEKNPFRQARLVYNYMCRNFTLEESVRRNDADVLDLIAGKSGDAYDFAVVYTALLRALNIPCITDSGVLVNQDLSSVVHWWNEFYIQGVGWIPVDVAMGSGYSNGRWQEDTDDNMYYFGNLDSHHIAFSRGWNKLKPFSKDNMIVQMPRSYALQSIWEEASAGTAKYSSFWSVPVVKGVY